MQLSFTNKAGNDVFDLGEALYGFLLRYGEEFDYAGGETGDGGMGKQTLDGAKAKSAAAGMQLQVAVMALIGRVEGYRK